MKKILIISLLVMASRSVHATSITAGPLLTNTNIVTEMSPTSNGTTVQFSLDVGGQVEADFYQVSAVDSSLNKVATVIKTYSSGGPQTLFWNGLWLIGTDFARHNGTFSYQIIPSTNGTAGTALPPTADQSSFFTINSVDIHNLIVIPSLDATGQPTFPYLITYALAKTANVTASIADSSGTVVRNFSFPNQASEATSSATITWDGLGNNGQPVSIATYQLTIIATDRSSGAQSLPRFASIDVLSLAGAAQNAQKLFEDNVYVFPNPVRNGQGIFKMEAIRAGANLSLKIYTITGTLVRSESFPGIAPGNINTFTWDATNESGNKVGRGLYYYVVREQDSQGTLQTVKKMAVLP